MSTSYETLSDDLCEARDLLERGEIKEAYQLLGGPTYDAHCTPLIIAGEASFLIRAGLIGEAIERIDGFLSPNFEGRVRYAATNCEAAR